MLYTSNQRLSKNATAAYGGSSSTQSRFLLTLGSLPLLLGQQPGDEVGVGQDVDPRNYR